MSMVAVTSRSFSRNAVLRAELLARWPDCRFNDAGASLRGEALVEFISGCGRAILSLERVDDLLLDRLPDLRVISKFGVGLDSFDLSAMARHGVRLAWTPGTNARSVAELALMFSLALLRRLPEAQRDLRAGKWRQCEGGILTGRCVGIVGFGAVGRDLATLMGPFGGRLLAYDPAPDQGAAKSLGVSLVKLEDLLSEADVVSLHAPLTPATRNLMNATQISRLKPTAVLVNTARGALVDEAALLAALDGGMLAGAGLDSLAEEPPVDRRLLDHPRVLVTPHVGGSTTEAVLAMGRAAIAGLDAARPAEDFLSH